VSFQALRRELGSFDASLYAVAVVLNRASVGRARLVKYYLTMQPVAQSDLTPARRGRHIVVREIGADEALALDVERPKSVIEARLAHGGRCLVAEKDGRLLGFQWFTLQDYPEDDVRCLFRLGAADGCAWDYDIFVYPEHRTQPVFLRLWDRCNALLRQSRIRWSLSRINAFNAGSKKSHERLGATVIASAYFLCVGPLQVSLFSCAPWFHVAAREDRRPTVHASRIALQAEKAATRLVVA
jgi:GNAT superfamily N-acetyltransferase